MLASIIKDGSVDIIFATSTVDAESILSSAQRYSAYYGNLDDMNNLFS